VRRLAIAALVLHSAAAASTPPPSGCPIQGEATWWIVDVCMASLETDDEIAASDCIEVETARRFRSACAAKLHYKQQLCELAIARGTQSRLEACMVDPEFRGPTVRNQGVGR